MKSKILICDRHGDYKVPLIYTFAFPGAEYWCPYCGTEGGMFGTGIEVPATEALAGRKQIYIDSSEYYLDIRGTMCCSSLLFENKRIEQKDIPKNIIDELVKFEVEHKWEYRIKATILYDRDIIKVPKFECVHCEKFTDCDLWIKERKVGIEGPCKDWKRKEG